jgi:hypothetical protein
VENVDLLHLIFAGLSIAATILGGLFGIVKWLAAERQKTREDFDNKLQLVQERLEERVSEAEHGIESKVETALQQMGETMRGVREKINSVELDSERRFMPKGNFDDFRKEYREDMKRIFDRLDRLPAQTNE